MQRKTNMPAIDPRVGTYITKSAAFAQPILVELRERVHKSCPKAEETLKWGMPAFMYGGKILAHMGAFKQHAVFGFWRGEAAAAAGFESRAGEAMGQFGRLTDVKQLPPKAVFAHIVKGSMALIDSGAKPSAKSKPAKKPVVVPAYFLAAVKKSKKALATFEAFTPSQQREYVEWITEAKAEATRDKRLALAVEWLAEGKRRNWKYENC